MSASQEQTLEPQRAAELLGRIEENVHHVIVGKEHVVRLAVYISLLYEEGAQIARQCRR